MSNAAYVTITDGSFEEEVLQSDLPVLVDFGAAWCTPCKMIEPAVEEIASEYQGKVKVGKIDVDSNPEVAAAYGVRGLPSLLFFKNGEVVDKIVGAVPKSAITQKLAEIAA